MAPIVDEATAAKAAPAANGAPKGCPIAHAFMNSAA
eukprot:CAMPEP_0204033200 /NCGR_PEP_ID=MMETSP0360-20130528/69061_1 /ASSEMBLY_ACC=CAM_ASM_000342 /TAXON_ID=268821 /ORGANISM="Scrippsiella Hangoei, Strain SHTV-5" /LENGTH=35 /DNA_ID= /DNA_START= /DNA_END= /DNA_ORIENTATION=